MTTLATTHPTLLDVAKRTDPDGSIAKIVEQMNATNEILDDMVFMEGNLQTGNRTTVRTGLPEPTWRKLYGGVQPTKSRTAQVTDSCGMLEAYAEVDKALADLNGNTEAFRLSEDAPHIEGMNQELASTLFYGNESSEPEAFTGFAPRFNAVSGVENSDNVIDCGGNADGDNTSIWLINWGPNSAFGIYPKGSNGGLQMQDKGQVTIEDLNGDGGRMEAYRTHYRQDAGLVVRDWRHVVRIANIKVGDLTSLSGTQAITAATSILKAMIGAAERIPSLGSGRPAFYCNRTVREFLRKAILDKVAANLTFETVAGKRVVTYDGIPVRRTDAILSTEDDLV